MKRHTPKKAVKRIFHAILTLTFHQRKFLIDTLVGDKVWDEDQDNEMMGRLKR